METPDENNGSPTFVRISNQMVYTELQATRRDIAALQTAFDKADMPGMNKRIRSLELKFYGVLAALISSLVVIVATAAGASK